MCNIYKHNYNQCIKSMGRMIYNANRHIYILKETFGLTEIQPLKYTSQISRFCLYFWVTVIQYKSTLSRNPKLCVVIIYQCGKFVSRGGNIGRAILMLSIYLLLNFRNLRRAIYKHWHGAFIFIFCLLIYSNIHKLIWPERGSTSALFHLNCNFEKSHTNTSRSFRRSALTLLPMASSHSALVDLAFLRKKLAR
jgi:hypothetical protein